MNFLGIGLPEMLVIFAVALLVFGPRKLPEVGRALAKTLRSLQDAAREFEAQLTQEAQELEKAARASASQTAAAASPKTNPVATAEAAAKPVAAAEPGAAADNNPPTADAA
ncbi:TatA/E family twin arginine-targeting protein translocase [Synechococcus sp. H70.2]|uniref:TatA/E family twin arginine-targeting protein translocase n=1 Tax=unclassified Synechococcus TaxID=2626047 RepID=UPI0039C0DFEE